MNIDQLVKDTFEAHEHLAPDADQVLDAVHRHTGGHIASRPSSLRRPAAVLASAAVVAGVTVGAVTLSGSTGNPAPQAGATSARHAGATSARHPAGSVGSAARSAPRAHAPRSGSSDIAPPTMPFDLGWVPEGDVHYLARRINTRTEDGSSTPELDGEYLFTVRTASGPLDIDVQQMPGDLSGVQFKSGPGVAVTIAGRPGIESTRSGGPGGYEVYFRDAAGGMMYVNVWDQEDQSGSAAEYIAVGRRIAAAISFPGTTSVIPGLGGG